SAPAAAAIMAAVAGLTALAIGSSSDFEQREREYEPAQLMGQTLITGMPAERFDAVKSAVVRELGGGVEVQEFRRIGKADCYGEEGCVNFEVEGLACENGCVSSNVLLVSDDPRVLRFYLGRDDPALAAALASGKAVLFGAQKLRDGAMSVRPYAFSGGEVKQGRRITVPAVHAESPVLARPEAVIPPSAAARFGVPVTPHGLAIDRTGHVVTPDESGRIEEAAKGVTGYVDVYTERGFTESFALPALTQGAAGAVIAMGGTLIATGLSAADARPDLATLAAIGAKPRTRRLLLMGQAAFISLLGCWLGVLAGFAPGIAAAGPLTENYEGALAVPPPGHTGVVDVPWLLLLAITVGVPLAAVATTALFSRSRLPLTRRLAA
ncbi:FtsX-like permease family protein, partial [Actinocorallia lasiicapitis]